MSDVCFVFASGAEKEPQKIINKYLKDTEYDVKYLHSGSKEKILKKDIDLDFDDLEDFKILALMGAEPLKYIAGMTGVQKYNGMFIEKKYLPIMNPNIVVFKPQLEDDIIRAFNQIPKLLSGEDIGKQQDKDYCFIETEEQFNQYKEEMFDAKTLVVDIETTSVSPHTGTILGIAISTRPHQGLYVSIDIVNNHRLWFHTLFYERNCIFHNSKFDTNYMETELGFEFPEYEDTMLLHYCLEEAVGTHGLKPLALRFTDLGDYERELDDYKKSWARKNKVKLADFNYGMLPSDILAPYACKDADATFQLYGKFKPLVDNSEEFSKLYKEILLPATHAILDHYERHFSS